MMQFLDYHIGVSGREDAEGQHHRERKPKQTQVELWCAWKKFPYGMRLKKISLREVRGDGNILLLNGGRQHPFRNKSSPAQRS